MNQQIGGRVTTDFTSSNPYRATQDRAGALAFDVAGRISVVGTTFDVLVRAYEVNIVLGIFNLIPIPPLDGSRILGAMLPQGLYVRWAQLDQVGLLALFGLIFIFNDQFWEVFGEVLSRSTDFMVRVVGG